MAAYIETRNLLGSYHKFYKKEVENPVDVKVYMKIVFGFIKFLMSKVLDAYEVDLGPGDSLGTIAIKGRKILPTINENGEIKGVAPSWVRTKQVWQKAADEAGLSYEEYIATTPREKRPEMVYCFNEHSNGIKYRFYWFKEDMRLHNKVFYCIAFNRENKRNLMKAIRAGKEYAVIPLKELKAWQLIKRQQ